MAFSLNLSRRHFLSALGALPAAIPAVKLLAQEPAQKDPTFSTDVKVISVLATVRDKQGHIVNHLGQDDFTLTEDGRSQTIRYFSRETDLPLVIGLLVDTSLSQRRVLAEERSASFRFLDKVLRAEKDRTFVMHFDRESELLQDLTSSRTELQKALDALELPPGQGPQLSRRGGNGGNGGGGYPGGGSGGGISFPGGGIGFPGGGRRGGGYPGGGRQQGGGQQRRSSGPGTTMYDAIYLASNEILRKEQGRKAVILLTDGVDNGSKVFLNDAIEAAQRADTLVYSILFADSQAYQAPFGARGGGPEHDGKKVLQQLSRETGGSFYEVSKKLTIDQIYDRLQEELRNQYSLGYTSDNPASAAGYRTIKVGVRTSGMTVQSREGYYPSVR